MSEVSATSSGKTVVIDIGKQKRKKVKDLRKGKGSLLDEVQSAVSELQSDGVVSADAQVVVVVVERKAKRMGIQNPMSMLKR